MGSSREPQDAAEPVEIDLWLSGGVRVLDPIEIVQEVGELPPALLGLGGFEGRDVPEERDLLSRPLLEIVPFQLSKELFPDLRAGVELLVLPAELLQFLRRHPRRVVQLPIERLLEDQEAGEMALELVFQTQGALAGVRFGDEPAVLESTAVNPRT
jgi:hypothetical protein